jgi:hypothetical protein
MSGTLFKGAMGRARRRGGIAGILALVALATGCAGSVSGTPRPAAGITPRPVVGSTIEQALLDRKELTKALDLSVQALQPPRLGGSKKLFNVLAGPNECLGVLAELQSSTYQSADVLDIAWESWLDAKSHPAVLIAVDEGVVALPSAVEADSLFSAFAQQWNRCNGKTADYRSQSYRITDVRVTDSVLAATVQTSSTPMARAIGVRVNCVVEVKVPVTSDEEQGPVDPETRAIDIARLMMDKVSQLS